jgi:hypothetical protein
MSLILLPKINKNKTKELDEAIEKSFSEIKKIYNVEPSKIEEYIEQNFEKLSFALINFLLSIDAFKIIETIDKTEVEEFISDIESGKIGSSYDKEILNKIADAYSLEDFNETPFFEVIKSGADLNSKLEIFYSKLKAAGFDENEFIKLSNRIAITFYALLYGLLKNDKKLEPALKVLAELFKNDVEEKDNILTLLEIYSDEEKRKEFEESYNEALEMMGKSV